MHKRPPKTGSPNIGCVFLVGIGATISLLLFLNSLFVRFFFGVNLAGIDDRVFQAIQFVLPIVMIFIQFWIYDWWTLRRKL